MQYLGITGESGSLSCQGITNWYTEEKGRLAVKRVGQTSEYPCLPMDKLENRHNWDFLPKYQMCAYNRYWYLAIINNWGFSYSWWYWKSLTHSYFKFCCSMCLDHRHSQQREGSHAAREEAQLSFSIHISICFCSAFVRGSSQGLDTVSIFENWLHSKNQTDDSKEKIEERVNKSLSEMALYWKAGIYFMGIFLPFFFFLDAKIIFVKFWDFQMSSNYILVCQRSTIQKAFLNVPAFFRIKREVKQLTWTRIRHDPPKWWTGHSEKCSVAPEHSILLWSLFFGGEKIIKIVYFSQSQMCFMLGFSTTWNLTGILCRRRELNYN